MVNSFIKSSRSIQSMCDGLVQALPVKFEAQQGVGLGVSQRGVVRGVFLEEFLEGGWEDGVFVLIGLLLVLEDVHLDELLPSVSCLFPEFHEVPFDVLHSHPEHIVNLLGVGHKSLVLPNSPYDEVVGFAAMGLEGDELLGVDLVVNLQSRLLVDLS